MTLAACHQSADPSDRYVLFKGRMATNDTSLRMQMRYAILERTGSRWADVTPPEVAVWNQAQPNSRAYTFTQRIDNLKVGARYRTATRFRWLDSADRTVAAARRKSAVCKMRDLRPDLVPGRIVARRLADSGETRYEFEVSNRGKVAAVGFSVDVSANGASLYSAGGLSLGAGSTKTIRFAGPACLTGEIVARVDTDNRVDERSETNNEVAVTCPAG